ncbi:MAG: hypothetical protein ABI608_07260 [Rhizomicrobium sp.]
MSYARVMRGTGLVVAALAFVSSAAAQELSQDVRAYVNRRAACNYWLSERSTEPIRRGEIQRHIGQLRCDTLDREEAVLKARYRETPSILDAIADAHDAMPD